jgi:peptide/nickel transport system substrate-binding protein
MLQANRPFRRNLIVFAAAVVLLAACTDNAEPAATGEQGRSGGTMRIGIGADVTSLNPLGVLSAAENTLLNQLYNTLIQYDQELEAEPELATSWEFSEDGRSLTLHLRDGVSFHSGRPFTSEDVAFSVDYAKDPENGALIQPLAARVDSVETPDDTTAVLHFTGPFPGALDLLDLLFIIDRDTADEGFSTTAVGTGPFELDQRVVGDRISLVRNDDYWREPAQLERVELVVLPDYQSQIIQLESGEIQYVEGLEFRDGERFQSNPGFNGGASVKGAAVLDLIFNVRTPPFDNVAVRQALDLAVDRERIGTTLFGDAGEAWCSPFPEESIAYVEELADGCEFDLDEAARMLSDAGAEGIEVEILTSTAAGEGISRMADIIQSDFSSIGVVASIKDIELAAYQESVVENRDFAVASHSFGRALKDPSSLLETTVVFRPEDNASGFESEQYAALVAEAGSEQDPDERARLYQEVAQVIFDEKFVVPVAPIPVFWASDDSVTGLEWTRDGFLVLEGASVTQN